MATRHQQERLAPLPQFRESVTIRPATDLRARLAAADRRDAFLSLFANAPRKPDAIYELQRADPRIGLPGERERKLIHEGIAAGYITREQIIAYRASQLHDDLAAFGGSVPADESIYIAFMTETAEAVDAATKAKGMPTQENVSNAIRQLRDVVPVAELHVAALSRGYGR